MKKLTVVLLSLAIVLGFSIRAKAQVVERILVDNILVSGLTRPVQVTHAGDGSERIFVVEKPGRLRVVQNGALVSTPMLDMSAITNSVCSECGFLGVAFHPNYGSNRYFYVNYTDKSSPMNTVIARYTASSANPNVADPASRKVLLTIAQPQENHNGGQLLFGPDGYLYIGMGDGGSGGDPSNNAQNIEVLLGKMLRIDVNNGDPYGIPAGNPYAGKAGRDEIWALGLRNPWRFSFDRLNGDLYIGDVGQNLYEEISFLPGNTASGKNLGWRCMEGAHIYNTQPPCNDPAFLATLTPPIAEYSHSVGFSVTGGFVYRGNQFPDLYGQYFYGDFGSGKIWSMKKNQETPPTFTAPILELDNSGINISSFGEDEAGELYITDYYGGYVRKLESMAGPGADLSDSTFSRSTPTANVSEAVTFTIELVNSGGTANGLILMVPLKPELLYETSSLSATSGLAVYNAAQTRIEWSGNVSGGAGVVISYRAAAVPGTLGSITTHATLSGAGLNPLTLATYINVPRAVLESTIDNFFLPGTQPNQINQPLQSSTDCDTCHTAAIYDRWRGSAMSQAGRDPVFWAAMSVANAYAPNSGEYCLRCHTSTGWLSGRSSPADGSALTPSDIHNGVACLTCHRMVDPVASPGDEASGIDSLIRASLVESPPTDGTVGSAMMIIDPNDNRRGPFDLAATFGYHSAYQTDFLGANEDAIGRARICGTCHNLSNPLLEKDPTHGNQYWPIAAGEPSKPFDQRQIFPIERTFDEWRLSEFATGSNPQTCQDCHMPKTTGKAADDAFNPVYRDCVTTGCLPEHTLVGSNTWLPELLQMDEWRLNSIEDTAYLNTNMQLTESFMKTAARLEVGMGAPSGGTRTVDVTVTNLTGHKLPTGYPEGRRMWIHLQAYDEAGNLVYESGAYDPVSGVLDDDPDVKVYEAKLGMTDALAATLGLPNDSDGSSFFFALNNTFIKDSRIPPRGYDADAFNQDGLRPVMADPYPTGQYWDTTQYEVPEEAVHVTVQLYYQVASREYIEFLEQYGGLDGEALYSMWEQSKSPPVLMAIAFSPGYYNHLPVIRR